jgi:hypothetical protein
MQSRSLTFSADGLLLVATQEQAKILAVLDGFEFAVVSFELRDGGLLATRRATIRYEVEEGP